MLDEYQSLIDELLETPTLVRAAMSDADEESGAEVVRLVAALNERDRQVLERTGRIRDESSAHLTKLPDLGTAVEQASAPENVDALLEEFDTVRGELVSRLINLTLADWAKEATHDAGGHVALVDEIEEHVEFDEAIRARIGG